MQNTAHRQAQGKRRREKTRRGRAPCLKPMHRRTAGIEVGATHHGVAVPADRDAQAVRPFAEFAADLHALADGLRQCRIDRAAMASTGVYGPPRFEVLEARGVDVKLVNSRLTKPISGRKPDVHDGQWLHELHTYGDLWGRFGRRPRSVSGATIGGSRAS